MRNSNFGGRFVPCQSYLLLRALALFLIACQSQFGSAYALDEEFHREKQPIRFGSTKQTGARICYSSTAKSLELVIPNLDARGSNALAQVSNLSMVGGALLVSTAEPESQLANVRLKLRYDPKLKDGRRFCVLFDEDQATLPLYDWELKPLANLVELGHHGAISIKVFSRHEKVSLAPAFEKTLLGLRFIQADLMPRGTISSQNYLPSDQAGILLGAGEPGRLASPYDVSAATLNLESLISNTKLEAAYSVLTDANVRYLFQVENNELILSGTPYYFFWKPSPDGNKVVALDAINAKLKRDWGMFRQANPLVIESMERSFRTVAFMRYAKRESPQEWARFMTQVKEIELATVSTPQLLLR